MPHRPQGVLRVAVARGVAGERQQAGHPPGRVRGRAVDQGELARVAEGGGQRLLRRLLARGLRGRPQRPAEPAQAQGVAAAQWTGQQLRGGVLVERARAQRAPQQEQQWPRPRLGRERQLVSRDHRRHPGRHQRAAQQRDLVGHRPDQHRHRRPVHAVVQVRAPQHVRDHRGFLAGAGGGDHPNQSRAAADGSGSRSRWPPGAGRAACWPPAGTPPAGRSRCAGRSAARSPGRAGRRGCGTARGSGRSRARPRPGRRRSTGPGHRPRSAPCRRRPGHAATPPAPDRCPGTRPP